ncbi:uncharacterized protein LOC143031740 [Oratosquilla oratoria]|uniref:uncharacterized protein LOC143031740 n=1 Tax=Oratosquilla oratoria TaxID=337810 RepID=UPI003F75D833
MLETTDFEYLVQDFSRTSNRSREHKGEFSFEEVVEKCDNQYFSNNIIVNGSSLEVRLSNYCHDCELTEEELGVLLGSGQCHIPIFSYLPLIYALYSLVLIVALVGNSLVMYTVVALRKMHTVTNYFIANLALGDLFMAVFCVPFSVVSILDLTYWPFGKALCIGVNYLQGISVFVSSYTLVAISVDRYLAIVFPLRPRLTRLQARGIIVVVWVLAILTTLPIALFSDLISTGNRIHDFFDRKVCLEVWPEGGAKFYTLSLMVLQYFLPITVLVVTYSRIACVVWGSRRDKKRRSRRPELNNLDHQSPVTQDEGRDWTVQERNLLRKSSADYSPAKMIKMICTVVVVYSLCWLPFNLLLVMRDWNPWTEEWLHLHHIWFVFHWLAMSHTCYNPVILCWMNIKFRAGYVEVLYRLLPCCRGIISRKFFARPGSPRLHRLRTCSTCSTVQGSCKTYKNSSRLIRFRDEMSLSQKTSAPLLWNNLSATTQPSSATDSSVNRDNRQSLRHSRPIPVVATEDSDHLLAKKLGSTVETERCPSEDIHEDTASALYESTYPAHRHCLHPDDHVSVQGLRKDSAVSVVISINDTSCQISCDPKNDTDAQTLQDSRNSLAKDVFMDQNPSPVNMKEGRDTETCSLNSRSVFTKTEAQCVVESPV